MAAHARLKNEFTEDEKKKKKKIIKKHNLMTWLIPLQGKDTSNWSTHNKIEPPHDKTNNIACAPREVSDQPGHPPSLISLRCPHEETLGPQLLSALRRL